MIGRLGSAGATDQSTSAGTMVSGSWTSYTDQRSWRKLSKNLEMEPAVPHHFCHLLLVKAITESHILKAKGHRHPQPQLLQVAIFNMLHLARFPQGNTSWGSHICNWQVNIGCWDLPTKKYRRSARKRGGKHWHQCQDAGVRMWRERLCVISNHRFAMLELEIETSLSREKTSRSGMDN